MKGRKPKPSHLKLVDGNPGKREIPLDPLRLQSVEAEPPSYLDSYAREAWNQVVPPLVQKQLFTQLDHVALATWCAAYGQWRRALEALEAAGEDTYVTEGRMGKMIRARPQVGIANEAIRVMNAVGSNFGFSPAARLRLRGVEQGDLFDPFAEFAKA
ncbi:MAG TPA: phage terminase small subunit P27 family [Roseomonas sp.]|nr:phage terminase small subunit P27 family [Roseomonas sp.]